MEIVCWVSGLLWAENPVDDKDAADRE
jgi:hypothetical protein